MSLPLLPKGHGRFVSYGTMTTATGDLAIDLRNVVKIYKRRVHALQGVTFRVRRGEVFGLLGPNGAGKSTLVKIMMTVIRATRAEGQILGQPVGNKPTLARVGYLPENHRFPKYLTGRQVLEFFASLAKVDRATRRRRTDELLETVGMREWANTKIATYSKGMLQRVGLAQALVHEPDLVVLDEPTDGVDPVGRRDILDVLGRLRGQGKTVFINSHALSELEVICDRVAILVKGHVAREGSINELTIAKQRYEIEIAADDVIGVRQRIRTAVAAEWTTSSPGPVAPAPPALPASMTPDVAARQAPPPLGIQPPTLSYAAPNAPAPRPVVSVDRGRLRDGPSIELEGPVLRIETTDPSAVQGVLDALRRAGLVIRRMQPVRPSLEDLFLDAVVNPETGARSTPGGDLSATQTGGTR